MDVRVRIATAVGIQTLMYCQSMFDHFSSCKQQFRRTFLYATRVAYRNSFSSQLCVNKDTVKYY